MNAADTLSPAARPALTCVADTPVGHAVRILVELLERPALSLKHKRLVIWTAPDAGLQPVGGGKAVPFVKGDERITAPLDADDDLQELEIAQESVAAAAHEGRHSLSYAPGGRDSWTELLNECESPESDSVVVRCFSAW